MRFQLKSCNKLSRRRVEDERVWRKNRETDMQTDRQTDTNTHIHRERERLCTKPMRLCAQARVGYIYIYIYIYRFIFDHVTRGIFSKKKNKDWNFLILFFQHKHTGSRCELRAEPVRTKLSSLPPRLWWKTRTASVKRRFGCVHVYLSPFPDLAVGGQDDRVYLFTLVPPPQPKVG